VSKARHLAAARGVEVDWVLADLRTYQPPPHCYDLVVVLYLHLPPEERRSVHAAAAQALSPGGTLLVIGHDRTNLSQGYGGPQEPGHPLLG
jgi:Methyltransferase domain